MNEHIIQKDEAIVARVNNLEAAMAKASATLTDIYSLGILQPLLHGYSYLPFTASALRPFCLAHIANDIIMNDRKNIIEFGSGLSTILIGRLIKKNKLNTRIFSVEHNQEWVQVLNEVIDKDQLNGAVEIIYAPLSQCSLALENMQWYDLDVLDQETADKQFDMVIVDGPPAWKKGLEKARYPAFPYIINKLGKRYVVYLDDAERQGERSVLHLWKQKYEIEFNVAGETLAYFYERGSFNNELFKY